MRKLNVLLIGDEERRGTVKSELRGRRDISLAGEIGHADALKLVPRLDSDVIVLDLAAEGVNGMATLPWLVGLPGERVIIALGASNSAIERRLALELGATGYAAPEGAAAIIGKLAEQAPARDDRRLLAAA